MILALEPNARILLVCAEALSRRVNWQDRATCVLFGDGAGAVVLSAEEKGGFARLEDVLCTSDGALWDLITIGGGGAVRYEPGDPVREEFFINMRGREIFKHAVRSMTQVCGEILARNNCGVEDVRLFVPHQANLRIIEAVGERLEIPAERVFTNVAEYGNTSSASIPLALYEARARGRTASGFRVLATGFGGGLTWGAALFRVL
jgi:3-oxoacyl-[acyl-carrier-protein] synthase-3